MEIDQISTICLISLYLAIGWKLLKTSGKILLCKLKASESCYAFSRTSLRESVMDGSNPNSKSLELLQKCIILFGADVTIETKQGIELICYIPHQKSQQDHSPATQN